MASPQQVHSKRVATTTALQALTLYNNDQVFGWSQALASRVIREAGDNEAARLDRLYQLLFARNPDSEERTTLLEFLDSHEKVIKDQPVPVAVAKDKPAKDQPAKDTPVAALSAREAAFVDLVHTVANSNDFAYRF
jgi:hypothetical protein